MNKRKKNIVILGATGSVGRDVLAVIRANSNDFKVIGLSCNTNTELLKKFAEEFSVKKICAGTDDLTSLLDKNIDLVVNCISGEDGTEITREALTCGINVALANKEALVSDGKELVEMARKNGVTILSIDSEICAIHQCLRGIAIDKHGNISHEKVNQNVEKIILTASGGPFFGKTRDELTNVKLDQVLKHPTWPNMGKKITVDSATLMNKGFEVIETAVLFGLDLEKIEVLIHPQSLVHGIVYFKDGNVIMHAAATSMQIPIHYCLYYPEIKENILPRLDLKTAKRLEFFEPDKKTFVNLEAAYTAMRTGTTKQLLRRNNENVSRFLNGEIDFKGLLNSLENRK